MNVRLSDGYTLFVEQVGDEGLPLIVLHGGPGLDHTHLRPWLDPLGEDFRVLYVDERGQGRSKRVDPGTLALDVFAHDVDLLAEALEIDRFALLGHSFGAIITTKHAIERGTAEAYVISGGGDSSAKLMADVDASLEAMGETGKPIADSWEWEKSVRTAEDCAELMRVQTPFHFSGDPPPDFAAETIYVPEVLRHFANEGYGDFDYTPELARVAKPTLVLVGGEDRTTTTRAARVLHQGISGSELVVFEGAGHMSMIEAQEAYLAAVRGFLARSSPALVSAKSVDILRRSVPNETVDTPQQVDDPEVWTTGPEGELIPDYESTFPTINEGEVVHGTVVRVDKDEVLVDIGYKSEGVIPVSELSIRRSVNPEDEVGIGEEIDALVLTKEDAEGRLILSKKRARFELAWKTIEQKAETGEPIDGRVIEVVKGGLILDLGVRGFLPASLVDIRRVQDLDEFLGQTLRCKVIELNRSRNNVVLSRRAVLEDERKEMRQAILDRLQPGDVVEGQISNIVDFGAFVDLDGMDGLIHISEISWRHVNHPSEVLEIGQTVRVKVLDIDRERQRISLGLKQTQSDPWQQVLDQYSEGDVVEGKVTKVVTFGAFVEIMPGVEGLVHISELAQHHVENPREVVAQGDQVQAKIIEVDPERRRLSLSLKRVEGEGPTPASELGLSDEVFGAGSVSGSELSEGSDLSPASEPSEGSDLSAGSEPSGGEQLSSGSELSETTGAEPSPEPTTGPEEPPVDSEATAEPEVQAAGESTPEENDEQA